MSSCRRIERKRVIYRRNSSLLRRIIVSSKEKPRLKSAPSPRSLSELPQCNLEIGRSNTYPSTSLRNTPASTPVSFRYSHHVGQARKHQGRTQDEEVWQERALNTSPHAKGQEVLPCGGRDKAEEGTFRVFNTIMKIIDPQDLLLIRRPREPEKESMPGLNDSKASLQN